MPFVNYAQLEEERVKFFSVFHIGLAVQDFSMTYFSKRPVLFFKYLILEQIYNRFFLFLVGFVWIPSDSGIGNSGKLIQLQASRIKDKPITSF